MAEYDTLEIKIEADSKQANTSIKNLSTSLNALNEAVKGLDTKRLVEVKGLLQGIAKIDFSNVIKGLQSVVSAFKSFNSKAYQKAVSETAGADLRVPPKAETQANEPNFQMVGEAYSKNAKAVVTLNTALEKYQETFKETFGAGSTKDIKDQIDIADVLRQALSELNVDEVKIKEIVRATRTEMKMFSDDELANTITALQKLGFSTERINGVISHLKTNAKDVKEDFKQLATNIEYTYKAQNQVKDVKITPPASYVNTLKDIKVITQEMVEAQRKYDNEVKQLGEAGFSANQVKDIMKALNQEAKTLNVNQVKQLQKTLSNLGYDSGKIKEVVKQLGEVEKVSKKGVNGLKKLVNQFKNIVRYRIIRKIIQDIYKALQEGLQNVIAYDTKLYDTMSRLSSSFTFLKNSIGAVLSPLIQTFAPVLEQIMLVVGELGNTFAEFFASVNGQSTFSKATYELKEYNKEAQKTQSLGIDELNVISQDNKVGGFTTEQVSLGKEENKLASTLKDVFSDIKQVVDKIVEAFKNLTSSVLPAISRLLTPIMNIVGNILELVSQLIDETFKEVNTSISEFADMLAGIFNVVATIINDLMPTLKIVVSVIAKVLNAINQSMSLSFKMIGDIFNALQPIVDVVATLLEPVVSKIAWVLEKIAGFVEYINNNIFAKAWEEIKSWFKIEGFQYNEARATAPQFATGGFPEDGFFFANHNELVGQFSNGRTAVANNEQITQGIYEAVRDAMRESGNQGNISIQIDGQELAKIITNKQNNFGGDVVIGGNINWGK